MTSACWGNRIFKYAVLAGLGLILTLHPVRDMQIAEAAQLATAKVDNVNLRSSPNASSGLVGQVNKGQQLPVLSKNGDWYKVQVGEKTAWVASWLVGVTNTTNSKVAVVSGTYINVRSGPGTSYGVAGKVYQGNRLTVMDQSGDWYKIQSGGVTGWVANWLVKVETTPVVTVAATTKPATPATVSKVAVITGAYVNVRSGPGTSYGLVSKVNQGQKLTVLATSGDWVKVKVGSTTGWVANWLVKVEATSVAPTTPSTPTTNQTPAATSNKVVQVNSDNLNLRSGPGTSYNVAGQVSRGLRLPVVSRSGDWYQVKQTNGTNAWVAGWLVSVVDEPQSETTKPTQNTPDWLLPPTTEPKPASNEKPTNEKPTNEKPAEQTNPVQEYAPEFKLVDLTVTDKKDHTYINITSEKNIEYNTYTLSNPFRYVVNITDVQLGELPETIGQSTELVEQIRTGFSKNPYITRIVVDLKKAARVKTTLSADKKTLTLDVSKISYSDGLSGKTIFLDAGHGGHDNGASGQKGLREKDVNLDITLKVAELLTKQGAKVVYSRSDDTFIELAERTKLANGENADIFVSIHSNANTNRAVGGTSTYYYAPTTLPELYYQAEERRRLAQDVQQELVGALGRRDIGVLQANFAVLRTSVMPSILIETAFVSNNEEEELLGAEDFREKAAEAIARGISAYFSGQ